MKQEKRKVLLAAFEAVPFIKTGGLGDVAGALPGAVRSPDLEVRGVLPKLRQIREEFTAKMQYLGYFYVQLGWRNQYCGLFQLRHKGVTWYFLDNEYYFGRDGAYGYFDDGERMAFFAKAVCECCRHLPDYFPDILHCNDWHTAMAPVFLREQYQHIPGYEQMRTVLTIHNLKFQGQYDPQILGDILGLAGCEAARNQLIRNGAVNYLAGAASYADRITTVSPSYAREICTPYFGEGLDDLFLRRQDILTGVLNGIDTASYDPARDPALASPYAGPEGKAENKAALQRELGLEENGETPLCVAVSRLTEQKGFDLLNAVADDLIQAGVQIAVLGTGDPRYENAYRTMEQYYPGRFSAQIRFSDPLSRRFYAGGDLFLMPSRFEPCGLSQMIAMRYGTLPVVRRTGGLADSVEPYNRFTGEGTGFGFLNFNAHEFRDSGLEAGGLYRDNKPAWRRLHEQAMAQDFGWRVPAKEYRKLYRSLFV